MTTGRRPSMLRAASLALALVCLTGCNMLLGREVYEESPHVEQRFDDLDATALVATSENSLKNAIIQMVRAGMTEGTIQLVRYQGDPKRDLLNAVAEVSNEEPIGKYAVYYMTYDQTQVLTSYHVTISIKYRCTPEQIAAIVQTSGSSGLMELMRQALSEFEPGLTVEMPYYDETDSDPHKLLSRLYFDNPAYALGYPELKVSLYPDSGLRRIVEMEMSYPHARSMMQARLEAVQESARSLMEGVDLSQPPLYVALSLHDLLTERVAFDYDASAEAVFKAETRIGDAWTIYGALALGRAVGEGYALAFKHLCDLADIPCRIVSGFHAGQETVWNIVQLEGNWYHMDVAADDEDSSYTWFLKNDKDMSQDHVWEESDYTCTADSVPIETLRPDGETAAADPSPSAEGSDGSGA